MTEYRLDYYFGYNGNTDEILIGGLGCNDLSDVERNLYISDALIHEYIHKILNNFFGDTTSFLFDTIGDSLRNIMILKKVFKVGDFRVWSEFIKKEGIHYFYRKYHITFTSLSSANIICNKRVVN